MATGRPLRSAIAMTLVPKAESTTQELPNSEGGENQTTYDESGEKQNSESLKENPGTEKSTEEHQDYIIIANNKKGGGGYGHSAALIGSKEDKFQFISKEGRDRNADGSSNNELSGGKAKSPIDQSYDNFVDFINDVEMKEYDKFIFIPISHQISQEMIKDMRREANSYYNVLLNNCGHAVENTLRENGFGFLPSYTAPNNSFEYVKSHTNNLYYERK